jgi:hypothetical protein
MNRTFKRWLTGTPLYRPMRYLMDRWRWATATRQWAAAGRPVPPPHEIKEMVLTDYARRYGLRVLVETGTCTGATVDILRYRFRRIVSIELSHELAAEAKWFFAPDPRIRIIEGDSGRVLGQVVAELDEPALFWLDGHYSAGVTAMGEDSTPVLKELDWLLTPGQPLRHVILIDDARCFGVEPGYPTLDELRAYVRSKMGDSVEIAVEGDSVRITPRGGGKERPA